MGRAHYLAKATITAVLNPLLPCPKLNGVPAPPPSSSLTLSISSASPSGKGLAFMNSRLCLLGDFDRQSLLLSSDTVSRYETTGSDFFRGMHAWSSSRSLRQISRCSSPAPAMMCSPLSSMMHCGEREGRSSAQHCCSVSKHIMGHCLRGTPNEANHWCWWLPQSET